MQVVFVKKPEAEIYLKYWPNITFLELPEVSSKRGVGEARHWMLEFAKFFSVPRYFSVDDSNFQWFGITLPGDPDPQFSNAEKRSLPVHKRLQKENPPGAQCDLPMYHVLRHIEQGFQHGHLTE